MKKTWKGKATDGFLMFIYYLLIVVIFHICVSVRRMKHQHNTFADRVFNLPSLLLSLLILTLVYSPVWAYYSKIPKVISIDADNRQLSIVRKFKSKSRVLQLNSASFHFQQSTFYSVLSIYSNFTGSRGQALKKHAVIIMVPAFGLSFNSRVLAEVVKELKSLDVPEITSSGPKSFSDNLYR